MKGLSRRKVAIWFVSLLTVLLLGRYVLYLDQTEKLVAVEEAFNAFRYTDAFFFLVWGLVLTGFFGGLYLVRNDNEKFEGLLVFGLLAEGLYIVLSGLAEYMLSSMMNGLGNILDRFVMAWSFIGPGDNVLMLIVGLLLGFVIAFTCSTRR